MEHLVLSEEEFRVLEYLVNMSEGKSWAVYPSRIDLDLDEEVCWSSDYLESLFEKGLAEQRKDGLWKATQGGHEALGQFEKVEEPAPYDWLVLRRLADLDKPISCPDLLKGCEALQAKTHRSLRRELNKLLEVGEVAVKESGGPALWLITRKGRRRL